MAAEPRPFINVLSSSWLLDMVLDDCSHEVVKTLLSFRQVSDIIISRLGTCTEEGKKVQRNGGKNFLAVFRRVEETS